MRQRVSKAFKRNRFPFTVLMFVFLSSTLTHCIGPGHNDFHVILIGEYCLWVNNQRDVLIAPKVVDEDTPHIPPTVTDVAFDNRFIYAKRTPPGTKKVEYWILDVEKSRVYGPFLQAEFASKLESLEIEKVPTLVDVYKYRPSTGNYGCAPK